MRYPARSCFCLESALNRVFEIVEISACYSSGCRYNARPSVAEPVFLAADLALGRG